MNSDHLGSSKGTAENLAEAGVIATYPSDFGQRVATSRAKFPKRVRRMSPRKVKRWLASEMQKIWDAAIVPASKRQPERLRSQQT